MDTRKESEPSMEPSHCVVEEYSVGVPMVRPHKAFLNVLKLAGATGEVFTVKEICGHLKNYISSRALYDVTDPRVVHCGQDLLGTVFGVAKFTINEALALINKHCYTSSDMCWKRKRRLVRKPYSNTPQHDSRPVTITVCHALSTPPPSSAVVTSSSSVEPSGPKLSAATSSERDVSYVEVWSVSEVASASIGETNIPSVSAETNVPSVSTEMNVPSVSAETNVPSVSAETNVPSVSAETNVPSVSAETNVPSVSAETNVPSVSAETNVPSVSAETNVPSVSAETNVPSVSAETNVPSVSAETNVPSVSAETNVPSVSAETNVPSVSAETNVPSVSAETNVPSVSAETNVPSVSTEGCTVKDRDTTIQTGCTSVSGQADGSKEEQSKPERKRKHKKRKRKSSNSAGSSRKRRHTEPSSSSSSVSSRRRGTSLSVTYHDDEASDGDCPWCVMVKMKKCSQEGDDTDDDDESEVLSIQDKDTISVKDSTDDYWFLEEEAISVHVDSDTEFAFEYELESDIPSQHSESDISSVTSGNGLLVVCKESDVEFFADYSDTESDSEDRELTDGDKWVCTEGKCNQSNLPMHRYCIRCWKIRSDWLPRQRTSRYMDKVIGSKCAYDDKNEDEGFEIEDKSNLNDVEMIKCDPTVMTDASKLDQGDSGVCLSSQPSSQDTVLSSCQLLETKLLPTHAATTESLSKSIGEFSLKTELPVDGTLSESLSRSISDFPLKTERPVDAALSESLSTSIRDFPLKTERPVDAALSESLSTSIRDFPLKTERPVDAALSESLSTSIRDFPLKTELPVDGTLSESLSRSISDFPLKTELPIYGAISENISKSFSDLSEYQSSLLKEAQSGEIRHSFSNIQVKNLSSSSLESSDLPNVAFRPSDGGVGKVTSSPLDDPCIVCLTQPKNASLIHGASGHQVCCFTCAKRLKRRGKVCPVCRRTIQKVVKNYIL